MMNRSLSLILVTGTALLASACVGPDSNLGRVAPINPLSRFTLQVEPDHDRIALAARPNGLSDRQRVAVMELVARYNSSAQQGLVIEVPAQADQVALQTANNIAAALQSQGVQASHISLASYQAPSEGAPVVVGFESVRAQVPKCGAEWGNLSNTSGNTGASNFGCSVTANLAAQIADPNDIAAPRTMTPPSAQRRTVVFDNYRQGSPTSATPEPLLTQAKISDVVE